MVNIVQIIVTIVDVFESKKQSTEVASLIINFILLLLVLVSMAFVYTLFGFHIYLTKKN